MGLQSLEAHIQCLESPELQTSTLAANRKSVSPEVLEFLVEKLVPPGLCLSEAWMNELHHINGHFH